MNAYTSAELIDIVRRKAAIHDEDEEGTTDADILEMLNEEMLTIFVPFMRSMREEYLVVTRRVATTERRIRMPRRSVAQGLRSLYALVDAQRLEIPRVERDYLHERGTTGTDISGYYFDGNQIVLTPDGSSLSETTLEMAYLFRPGFLVAPTGYRKIVGVDADTRTITLESAAPSSWETSVNRWDIHSPESGGEIKMFDLTKEDLTGDTFLVNEEIDGSEFGSTAPAIGDYMCAEGEAAVPALPVELHPALAQAAVVQAAEQIGDAEMVAIQQTKLERIMNMAKTLLQGRVEAQPRKVANRSPFWGQW